MKVELLEHQLLLMLLGEIEDKISQIENPYNEDIIKYKFYMNLLEKAITLLNKTINIDEKNKINNDCEYESILNQLNLIENNIRIN